LQDLQEADLGGGSSLRHKQACSKMADMPL